MSKVSVWLKMVKNSEKKKSKHENHIHFSREYTNICYIAMLETVRWNIL